MRRALKILPMPEAAELGVDSLAMALARIAGEPNDGWADLVVHPSRLGVAMKLARAHGTGEMKVRTLAESRMGHQDWMLRSATAEIVGMRRG